MLRLSCLIGAAWGQLPGIQQVEQPVPIAIAHCTKGSGCVLEQVNATMDANWRWTHSSSGGGNCYNGNAWDETLCPDPETCASECVLEGITGEQYASTYGVKPVAGGVRLNFKTGNNIGSRLYIMDSEHRYKLFKLKNQEFSFEVDVSTLGCGTNGAVYFSEMAADGGASSGNKAGAKFGTGYCDAQCPHDVKFIDGKANILEWNASATTGKYGQCCVEMDIWEANKIGSAFTPHVCDTTGPQVCTGDECGGFPWQKELRYKGLCDKDGCDFNAYRMGDKTYYGEGPGFTVDTSKPITIVTQWLTTDGTSMGDLAEIRQFYVQDGKAIPHSVSSILSANFDSVTESYCNTQKVELDDDPESPVPNDFRKKGGLKAMGQALDRGVVFVMSLWDDFLTSMNWLDSRQGKGKGSVRGPCDPDEGAPMLVRANNPDAYAKYTNIMYGDINTTWNSPSSKPELHAHGDTEYAKALADYGKPPPPPQPQPQPQPAAGSTAAASAAGQSDTQTNADGCSPAFGQCYGKSWTGPTCCATGCTCVHQGDFYGQCTPPADVHSGTCTATPQVFRSPQALPQHQDVFQQRRAAAPPLQKTVAAAAAPVMVTAPVVQPIGASAVEEARPSSGSGAATRAPALLAGAVAAVTALGAGVCLVRRIAGPRTASPVTYDALASAREGLAGEAAA